MKIIYTFILIFLSLPSCVNDRFLEKEYNKGINITPYPSQLNVSKGAFRISDKTTIYVDTQSEELEGIVNLFKMKIEQSTGFNLISCDEKEANQIEFIIDATLDLKSEGYKLTSSSKGILVEGKAAAGVFYGMQTLLQLLPAEVESQVVQEGVSWDIPFVEIKDEPRFAYRGFLIDSARHFWDIDFIKKQLDLMAMLKINVLHWHLTDDQGWRIEISKYPELTTIGAQRRNSNGEIYGPFYYTHDEVREIVNYAKERFIEVIPEIDIPGHSVAAVSAYPEYSCTGGPHEVRNVWGISSDIFCAGEEKTFGFLEDVFAEIIPLFESEYIHIGGDEADKSEWEKCKKCQKRIQALNLKADSKNSAERKLQSYFMKRVEDYLASSGKKVIGWEEIIDGYLSPTATVMSWRGLDRGLEAANLGNNVIMAPRPWTYLDQGQGDPKLLPPAPKRYVPLEKTYSLDPIPVELEKSKHHHILGVQAATWGEYISEEDLFEWFTYPRLIAVAEVAWTNPKQKDYDNFLKRLNNQRVRLDMHDVEYYIPIPEQKNVPSCDFVAFTNQTTLEFSTTEPVIILYTIDGTDPTENSKVYNNPLTFKESATLKIRSMLDSKKMGEVRTIRVEKQSFVPAVLPSDDYKGLEVRYYNGRESSVENLNQRLPDKISILSTPEQSACRIKNNALLTEDVAKSVIIEGYINIASDDIYYFSTNCDQLWMDDLLLIDNTMANKRNPANDKSIALQKGYHKIKLVRLANIIGGWVPQWEAVSLQIRKNDKHKFRELEIEEFR